MAEHMDSSVSESDGNSTSESEYESEEEDVKVPWFFEKNETRQSIVPLSELDNRKASWEKFPLKEKVPEDVIAWYSIAGFVWREKTEMAECYCCGYRPWGVNMKQLGKELKGDNIGGYDLDRFIEEAPKIRAVHTVAHNEMPRIKSKTPFPYPNKKCPYMVSLAFAKQEVQDMKAFWKAHTPLELWTKAAHLCFNQMHGYCDV
jgi:hypothetical protein